jgi:fatty acid CoA ligase FadD9
VIDRCNNVFKLANGEWVSPENVEAAFVGACQSVEQMFVYGGSQHEAVVAIIVPHAGSKQVGTPVGGAAVYDDNDATRSLLAELQAADTGLRHFEVPVCIHIAPLGFNEQNGLLTGSGKLCRWRIRKRYEAVLQSLFQKSKELKQLRECSDVESVLRVIASRLHSGGTSLHEEEPQQEQQEQQEQ